MTTITSPDRPELVGRDDERRFVLATLTDRGAVWVLGEAGMGKSSLVASVADEWTGPVARSAGFESDRHLAFAALRQIVRQLRRAQPTALPARLARVVDEPEGREPEDGQTSWYAVAEATTQYLDDVAERSTSSWLIVLDDVHWMDDASVKVMCFAARRRAAGRVSMLLSARPEHGVDPDGVEVCHLGPLGATAALLVVRRTAPAVGPQVARHIAAACQGWPLALAELTRSLSPAQLSGADLLPDPLPPGPRLEEVFERRTEALSDAQRFALLLVGLMSDPPRHRFQQAATAAGSDPVALDELVALELVVVRDTMVVPAHPLLADWIIRSASVDVRRRAHLAVAAVLADIPGADAAHQRAWHLADAAEGPDEQIARILDAVADEAARRGAGRSAAAAYRRAAELSEGAAPAIERWKRAGDAYRLSGDYSSVLTVVEEAERVTGDRGVLADLQLLRSAASAFQPDMASQLRRLVRDAQALPPEESGRKTAMLAFAAVACHSTDALHLATTAATTAEALIREAAPGIGHYMRAVALIHDERWVEGGAAFAEALDWLDELPDRDLSDGSGDQSVRVSLGPLMSVIGQAGGAERAVTPVVQRARADGSLGLLAYALTFRSEVRFRLGRWSEARKDAEEGLQLMRDLGQHHFGTYGLLATARVAAARGEITAALDDLEASVDAEAGSRGSILALQRLAVRVTAWLSQGELTPVLASVEASGYLELDRGFLRGIATVLLLPNYVEAGVRADQDWAHAQAVLLGRRAERLGHMAAVGAYLRCRAMLHGPWAPPGQMSEADALALIDQALAAHEQAGDPFGTARTLLVRAQIHAAGGRRERAAAEEARASAMLDHLGASGWRHRPQGASRSPSADANPAAEREAALALLTPAEARVAQAVAEGATNREVATRLGVSPKTVEYHLGNIYRKLDVSSRTQLTILLG